MDIKTLLKITIILLLVIISYPLAQEEKQLTKMERFVSNTGQIIKLENYYLPDMLAYNRKLKALVRVVTVGDKSEYFLLLIKEDKYSDKSAAIAEDDLSEVIKAFDILQEGSLNESSTADYLENKFTTEDGFQIGYAWGKNVTWFIVLEKYGESTVLFDNPQVIKNTLTSALNKIKELKTSRVNGNQ